LAQGTPSVGGRVASTRTPAPNRPCPRPQRASDRTRAAACACTEGTRRHSDHGRAPTRSRTRMQRVTMSRFTTQKDINEVVWRACDTFRGTIDPAQYKDYILVMLFLKFVSDLTREKREEYERRFGDDAVRVQRAMERERFIVPQGTDFYSLYPARNEPDIGDRINKALEKLEDANKAKLEGVFRAIDFK